MAEENRQLEADRELAERSRKEGTERLSKGKPTPTQEENDRAKLGEHIMNHEDDGSGPDPHAQKNLEAQQQHRGGYQTRHVEQPARQPERRPEPHSTTRHPSRSE